MNSYYIIVIKVKKKRFAFRLTSTRKLRVDEGPSFWVLQSQKLQIFLMNAHWIKVNLGMKQFREIGYADHLVQAV